MKHYLNLHPTERDAIVEMINLYAYPGMRHPPRTSLILTCSWRVWLRGFLTLEFLEPLWISSLQILFGVGELQHFQVSFLHTVALKRVRSVIVEMKRFPKMLCALDQNRHMPNGSSRLHLQNSPRG